MTGRSGAVVRHAWVALGLALLACSAHGQEPADAHLAAARALVDRLDLADTDYGHGTGTVVWDGHPASHTDCSGFINHLLERTDGLGEADLARWFGSRRPTADRYHDAIAAGRGFAPITSIAALRPGDLIAIRYLVHRADTGHVMLVDGAPEPIDALPPLVAGTRQWTVAVIDSSKSGHGSGDTRHARGVDGRDHPGLGRGTIRLYGDAEGRVAGFAWSTLPRSRFVPPEEEHLVLGRFLPASRP